MPTFEQRLTGGHPNSLGATVEIVEEVLADRSRLEELFNCYWSEDETVRLRVSNAMKRIAAAEHDWLLPYLDRLLKDVSLIDQPSAQWTLSQLFLTYTRDLDDRQRAKATEIMRRNLTESTDWIVLTQTMNTLTRWATKDNSIGKWLRPRLEELSQDERKSVRGRAVKMIALLSR